MSEESSPGDAARPARRRIVPLPERAALPVALIAHEGEEREKLEAQIARARPVFTFPSLAHFGADSARRERWAGIVLARTHAWDARLDSSVLRRAFIALYGLTDEGYGWPDAVKRLGTPEELDAWLAEIASPVLPPEDRLKPAKPKPSRSILMRSLIKPDPDAERPSRFQLALPSLGLPVATSSDERQLELPTLAEAAAASAVAPSETTTRPSSTPAKATGSTRPREKAPEVRESSPAEATTKKAGGRRAQPRAQAVQPELPLADTGRPAAAPAPRAQVSTTRSADTALSAREERQLSALALEIGLVRAVEILALMRARAHGR